MKLVSFSLWGDHPLYTIGAFENIELIREIYPGWKCRFYVPENYELIAKLLTEGAQVVERPWANPYFWRFLAADDPDIECVIFRDVDSRVNPREEGAVKEWLRSGKRAHLMKDAEPHRTEYILSGMWGLRAGGVVNMSALMEEWFSRDRLTDKYDDQRFLKSAVWPLVKDSFICHGFDSPSGPGVPFPAHGKLKYGKHVGEVIFPPSCL